MRRALAGVVALATAVVAGCGGDDEWVPPVVTPPPAGEAAAFALSETGLFRDIAAKEIAPDLIPFSPRYRLWTDGAEKRRWLRLPPDTQIDTSDADAWQLPVGAMVFKEFSREGRLLETRLIMRIGSGARDYWMGAFIWDDDEADARFAAEGADDVRGTDHDVPTTTQCGTCHNGSPGRVLGVAAVQLAGASPISWRQLAERGLISSAPPERDYRVPGDEKTAAALGYLHANCAHCHNPTGAARPDTDMSVRLLLADATPEQTNTYHTTVDVDAGSSSGFEASKRVLAGDPEKSLLYLRSNTRGSRAQMPAIGTEQVDSAGVALLRDWIASLP